ncbi:MAG: hypothetical protein Q8L55_03230 [Phycisphaerales bacterium]|nr:hypothetical protein [Phycisphaerales bacterium]
MPFRIGDHLADFSLRAVLAALGRGGSDPTFRADAAEVAAELARMRADPRPLTRPLVILSGYHTPAQVAWWLRQRLATLTSGNPADILTVSYPAQTTIEGAAEQSLAAISKRWGRGVVERPEGLDVVGISMGGLVARFAALAPEARSIAGRPTEPSSGRLPIARLFTFATPHQGSHRAARIAPDAAARDMKPDSAFLAALNAHPRAYPLVCYSQRGDAVVLPQAAAPPGLRPLVADGSRLMSHFTTAHNPWFLVDLARRLRGEAPLLDGPIG